MVVCTNRKQVRSLPQLTKAFLYREEIVPKSGTSTTADVSDLKRFYLDLYCFLCIHVPTFLYLLCCLFCCVHLIFSFWHKVWYDNNLRLVRYDFRPPTPQPPYYNTDAVTEIHDFNTGKNLKLAICKYWIKIIIMI